MSLIQKIYKSMPARYRQAFRQAAAQELSAQKQQQEATLPKIELSDRQVANCTVLPNRLSLLQHLPKGGNVAELGVDTGSFSQLIWDTCAPAHLHLVDAWDTPRYGEDKAQSVQQKFKQQLNTGTVQLHRGYSTDKAADFADGYFDWIYIDTNHTYRTTFEELRAYAPKMKPGGIIAGHDFITGNWIGGMRYGVREAVHEFCVEQGWEFLFITMEIGDNPSFAIRKMHS